jgi:hypothetical protein
MSGTVKTGGVGAEQQRNGQTELSLGLVGLVLLWHVAGIVCRLGGAGSRAFEVQGQESLYDRLVGHGRIPAVGGEDCRVQIAVGVNEPGRAVVVQVGQRPFRKNLRGV